MTTERVETLIIGGGQAGLAVGYHLARRGRRFVIIDAHERVGDAWRTRWDSLRLFTPAKYDGLPGMSLPGPRLAFPTKDEVADFFEEYARGWDLRVRVGVRAERVSHEDGRFVVVAGDQRFEADDVVVATGASSTPRTPGFAAVLRPDIVQLHSSAYRSPDQLREGDALVVGVGNSGAEIGIELSRTRRTILAGTAPRELPVRHGAAAAAFALPVIRFLGHRVITRHTPIGRRVGPKLVQEATPLIRTRSRELAAAGVERVPRVVGVRSGLLLLEDDRVVEVANVVWCTGFRSDFGWIDLPAFDEDGMPVHDRGVVDAVPGLYFTGLRFQYAATSDTLPGVGRDAAWVARHVAARAGAAAAGRMVAAISGAPA